MIQFLADNIDQLDLALDQLKIADRNYDRFALMLIDNVVELLLHRFAQDRAGENGIWARIGTPKHDPKTIEKALSRNFDAKAKAACKLGLLSNACCETVLNLHGFRNTAYHRGMRHDGILHSLAVFYFKNACSLHKAYKPRWWSWSSNDKLSYRALKYIGFPMVNEPEKVFSDAFSRLDCIADSMQTDLVRDLSSNLSQTIDLMNDAIDFLVNDGPEKKSRNEIVLDCQAWPFAYTKEAKAYAESKGCRENSFNGFVNWLSKNYEWPVKKDPVPSWRSRLDVLCKEKDYHKTLKTYCDFMRQTEVIRSQISESAAQLDSFIQYQIDVARGK